MDKARHRIAWWQELDTHGALVRRSRPLTMVVALLINAVITAIGVSAVAEGVLWFGVPTLLVCGVLGMPAIVWRLVTGRPVLRVDRVGVQVDAHRVPWSAVRHVSVFRTTYRGFTTGRVVVLHLTAAGHDELLAERSGLVRAIARGNGRLFHRGPAFELPIGQGLRGDAFADWLDEVRRHVREHPPER